MTYNSCYTTPSRFRLSASDIKDCSFKSNKLGVRRCTQFSNAQAESQKQFFITNNSQKQQKMTQNNSRLPKKTQKSKVLRTDRPTDRPTDQQTFGIIEAPVRELKG